MKKSLLAALIAATLCIPAVASADDETDMAKITCKEFLSAGESEMGLMLTWIDGYMSARSDNTMMSKAWMEKLGAHMASFCSSRACLQTSYRSQISEAARHTKAAKTSASLS